MGLIMKFARLKKKGIVKMLPRAYAGIFVLFCLVQLLRGGSFASLFATPDQLGQIYFNLKKYDKSAAAFSDPFRRGMAHYLNEDYTVAVDYLSQIDSDEALFNRANAWAHSMNYVYALKDYDQLLNRNPTHQGALKNRPIIQTIVDDIMRLSESQKEEGGDSGKMKKEDDPLLAEGAERKNLEKVEIEQYTADDLLNDPSISELWMKQVQADPAQFLSIKFQMQLQSPGEATASPEEKKGGKP